MKTKIHKLRTRIDGLAGLVKSLKPIEVVTGSNDVVGPGYRVQAHGKASDELIDCYKSLLLAKAWLGKILAELGEETPYKNDGNRKTAEDIEPTADVSLPIALKVQLNPLKPIGVSTRDMNHIEQIDWLREEIQKILILVDNVLHPGDIGDFEMDDQYDYFMLSEQHLTEARFHLGFELQRIKEQSK